MKRTMKVFGAGWAAGVAMVVTFILFLGGENLTQAGLRLNAVEQGFSLASRHWQFEATPSQEVELARWDTPENDPPAKKAAPAKKGAPRR